MEGSCELKIFPEFDGTGSVVECVKKVELVCNLLRVKQFDCVILLQFVAYQ